MKILGWKVMLLSLLCLSCLPEKEQAADTDASSVAVVLQQLEYFELTELSKQNISTTLSHYLHQEGQNNINEPCRILKANLDDTNPALIDCILEVEELDLYFNGFEVQLSVPSGVCEYITVEYFWFYKLPIGRSRLGSYTRPDCSACPGYPAAHPITGQVVPLNTCPQLIEDPGGFFDYSNDPRADGENCDEGTITAYSETFDVDPDTGVCSNPGGATPGETTFYGGNNANCAAGPGKERGVLTADEFPTRSLVLGNNGLIETHKIDAPITFGHSSNRYIANYTNRAADSLDGGGGNLFLYLDEAIKTWQNANSGTKEVTNINTGLAPPGYSFNNSQFDPWWGANNRTVSIPNPFYEFNCLNQAQEVRGRIRLLVREWDRRFDPAVDHIDSTIWQAAFVNSYGTTDDLIDTRAPTVNQNQPGTNIHFNNRDDWDSNGGDEGGGHAAAVTATDGFQDPLFTNSPFFLFPVLNFDANPDDLKTLGPGL